MDGNLWVSWRQLESRHFSRQREHQYEGEKCSRLCLAGGMKGFVGQILGP